MFIIILFINIIIIIYLFFIIFINITILAIRSAVKAIPWCTLNTAGVY